MNRYTMGNEAEAFEYEDELSLAVQGVVRERHTLADVLHATHVPQEAKLKLSIAIGDAIGNLDTHNCTQYGLTVEETRAWMQAGRPAGIAPAAPEPDFSEDPGAVIAIAQPGKTD
ncbi:MAG TPA: hypothetical protein VD885_03210 [Methylophilaceae bacterium]|nr:hypothetical protein [Methylophilaceae bacterium]